VTVGSAQNHCDGGRAGAAERSRIVQFADSVGVLFVVVRVGCSRAISFRVGVAADGRLAESHATALLIVACPCALRATRWRFPLVRSVGRLRHRVLSGRNTLSCSQGGTIWFDKTGHLTSGRPNARLVWVTRRRLPPAASIENQCNTRSPRRWSGWRGFPVGIRRRRVCSIGRAARRDRRAAGHEVPRRQYRISCVRRGGLRKVVLDAIERVLVLRPVPSFRG